VHFAVAGCTGWRFVAEECAAAGVIAHLADPGEAVAARGKKRRAKTDKSDGRHLRQLLVQARLPEAWVPPTEVQEWRAEVRLYKDLGNERTDWMQRVRATCFHQGLPARRSVFSPEGRAELLGGEGLSPAGAQQVAVALRQIARLDAEFATLHGEICAFGRRHAGCRALWSGLYGVGHLTSVMIWAEMGDTRRFSASRQAVRHTGLDITVYSSDDHRARGHLARQGPALLRWALFEAAKSAKPRARLLQRRRSTRRRQPGYVVGRPQARPPSPPHLERARRGGLPSSMSPRPTRGRPSADDLRGLLLPVTAASCCWAARIERAAAPVPPVGHPTSHHVTGHKWKPAHRNKSGRPRAGQLGSCTACAPHRLAPRAQGPMATAGSQAKSQLREGRRRWSTAVSQRLPRERRASSANRDWCFQVKRLTGWQLVFRWPLRKPTSARP
jgi:transposase